MYNETFNDTVLRLLPFIVLLLTLAGLEHLRPWRQSAQSLLPRWRNHFTLQLIAIGVVRGILPFSLIAVAIWSQQESWGLWSWLHLPLPVTILVSLLILDLAIYFQHRLMHRLPMLWRLHRLHHSDRVLDVTTALRFHPVEMLLSLLWKMLLVILLAAPVEAILLFEVLLSSSALFNHANIRLKPKLDRWLRYVLVTPDMHRVHHSRKVTETNTNFGFLLPWWDKFFASYRPFSAQGDAVEIGLNEFYETRENQVINMLTQPWRDPR